MAHTLPLIIDGEDIMEEVKGFLVGPFQVMNHRYSTPWWASEGDGPIGSGPNNPQLNSRMTAMNHRYSTPWWASEGDGPIGSGPNNPQLNSRMTILESLCGNGPLYAVETRFGGKKYGKVEVKGGRIYVNSFQLEKPGSPTEIRFISFQELLSRFNNGSIELPRTVFFLVTPVDEDESDNSVGGRDDSFEVIIKMEELSPRVKNFILLSSALKGPSYKGKYMEKYKNDFSSKDVYYHIRSPDPPVIEGIRDDDPTVPYKEGGVYGTCELNSWFVILLKDITIHTNFKLGVIHAGLQMLKEVRERKCLIKECGLMI